MSVLDDTGTLLLLCRVEVTNDALLLELFVFNKGLLNGLGDEVEPDGLEFDGVDLGAPIDLECEPRFWMDDWVGTEFDRL